MVQQFLFRILFETQQLHLTYFYINFLHSTQRFSFDIQYNNKFLPVSSYFRCTFSYKRILKANISYRIILYFILSSPFRSFLSSDVNVEGFIHSVKHYNITINFRNLFWNKLYINTCEVMLCIYQLHNLLGYDIFPSTVIFHALQYVPSEHSYINVYNLNMVK